MEHVEAEQLLILYVQAATLKQITERERGEGIRGREVLQGQEDDMSLPSGAMHSNHNSRLLEKLTEYNAAPINICL